MKHLRENLHYLRRGKSYKVLAEETGINYNRLFRIEKGYTLDPYLKDIDTLAKYFNVNIDDFLHKDLTK